MPKNNNADNQARLLEAVDFAYGGKMLFQGSRDLLAGFIIDELESPAMHARQTYQGKLRLARQRLDHAYRTIGQVLEALEEMDHDVKKTNR